MLKDCARKCSHCRHNGHNSRTCSKFCTGFKLFGVHIDVACDGDGGGGGGDESGGRMRKSKSMGNLQAIRGVSNGVEASGYLSDGFLNQSSKKKKGKPWSEEEHRSFLAGLETLGKGDWKGIARNFVPSRNSSQVASHAQKYFIRMAAAEKKRRRRSSVFDIPLNEVAHVTTSERPPLSPKSRRDNLNSRNETYIPNLSSFTHGFQAKTTRPSVSWTPHVNFHAQSSIFSLDNDVVRMNVANATYMSQPSVVTFRQALRQGSSQPNH